MSPSLIICLTVAAEGSLLHKFGDPHEGPVKQWTSEIRDAVDQNLIFYLLRYSSGGALHCLYSEKMLKKRYDRFLSFLCSQTAEIIRLNI